MWLSPPKGDRRGVGILLLILSLLFLSGLAEIFMSYKYITPDRLAVRSLWSPVEPHYPWTDVQKVKVSVTVHSSSPDKGARVSYLKWDIMLPGNVSVSVENAIRGNFSLMKQIYPLLPPAAKFETDGKNKEYWEYLRLAVFQAK
jgi:hypothetical protein